MVQSPSSLLSEAEKQIEEAGFRPITEIPFVLGSTLKILERFHRDAPALPSSERKAALIRLKALRSRLAILAAVLQRSAGIFQGYCLHAGVHGDEYNPGGISALIRDPTLLNLSV